MTTETDETTDLLTGDSIVDFLNQYCCPVRLALRDSYTDPKNCRYALLHRWVVVNKKLKILASYPLVHLNPEVSGLQVNTNVNGSNEIITYTRRYYNYDLPKIYWFNNLSALGKAMFRDQKTKEYKSNGLSDVRIEPEYNSINPWIPARTIFNTKFKQLTGIPYSVNEFPKGIRDVQFLSAYWIPDCDHEIISSTSGCSWKIEGGRFFPLLKINESNSQQTSNTNGNNENTCFSKKLFFNNSETFGTFSTQKPKRKRNHDQPVIHKIKQPRQNKEKKTFQVSEVIGEDEVLEFLTNFDETNSLPATKQNEVKNEVTRCIHNDNPCIETTISYLSTWATKKVLFPLPCPLRFQENVPQCTGITFNNIQTLYLFGMLPEHIYNAYSKRWLEQYSYFYLQMCCPICTLLHEPDPQEIRSLSLNFTHKCFACNYVYCLYCRQIVRKCNCSNINMKNEIGKVEFESTKSFFPITINQKFLLTLACINDITTWNGTIMQKMQCKLCNETLHTPSYNEYFECSKCLMKFCTICQHSLKTDTSNWNNFSYIFFKDSDCRCKDTILDFIHLYPAIINSNGTTVDITTKHVYYLNFLVNKFHNFLGNNEFQILILFLGLSCTEYGKKVGKLIYEKQEIQLAIKYNDLLSNFKILEILLTIYRK